MSEHASPLPCVQLCHVTIDYNVDSNLLFKGVPSCVCRVKVICLILTN